MINKAIGKKTPKDSPLLQVRQGFLGEKFVRLKHRITYSVWHHIIKKHIITSVDIKNNGRYFLDVGCGPGNFLFCLESWFRNDTIIGLDISNELLHYAAVQTRKVSLLQGEAQYLPLERSSVDVLSAIQVVEHFPSPEQFIGEAHRVLKENGLLLIATPNTQGIAARLLGNRWSGIRSDHISLRSPSEWRKVVENGGFRILEEGTTLFNGIPILGRSPLGLPFQLIQAIFGWFPWSLGESYMAVISKNIK